MNPDYQFPYFAMPVGFVNKSGSDPLFWVNYDDTFVLPQDALYASREGSIRMEYDADQDKLHQWITSKDPDDVLVEEYLGSIDNFKNNIGTDSVLVAFSQYNLAYDVPSGEAGFSDLKIVAAPEPVSSILFLTGAGLMGLSRLRKRMA